ncbi:MAG: hypothetical protein M1827_003137 [Pycnora praestabilis]|nr:MAG: hypothetical protein M1827_003137 [Pycnora praestabilis]
MPRNPAKKMSKSFKTLINRGTSFFTPTGSPSITPFDPNNTFSKAPEGQLFPKVDPSIDGEDCDRDCESCTIKYPAKWSIDEDEKLYGMVKGWGTHLLVATGKSDWVRDVEDEKGSVMEAVGKADVKPSNGRLMLSASNMPTPPAYDSHPPGQQPTTVLLLPSFTVIENVTPASVNDLIQYYIDPAPTTTTPLLPTPEPPLSASTLSLSDLPANPLTPTLPPPPSTIPAPLSPAPPPNPFSTHSSPHNYLILLCSQRTRDARCGQSAPLLRREFERHLRPLGLYRDLHDTRPGGVGIFFISHVGGHKFAANVMIYRRGGADAADGEEGRIKIGERSDGQIEEGRNGGVEAIRNGAGQRKEIENEATQCIWLARVRPEDCEGIIKYTVLQGKVVKPERQLRGGFDRGRGVVSW